MRAQDDTLALVMGSTWRPDWFVNMASKGALDLTMFREDVGLFPLPDQDMMRLVLPLQTFEFHYTQPPQKQGTRSYTFPGTDLRIDVLDPDGGRINVTYTQNNQLVTRLYVTMADDVAAIIAAEQKRRADIYAALLANGATLTSSAYGTIHLAQDMSFTWEGFGKLVPALIGPAARGKGTVDFTLHVAKEIAAELRRRAHLRLRRVPQRGRQLPLQGRGGRAAFHLPGQGQRPGPVRPGAQPDAHGDLLQPVAVAPRCPSSASRASPSPSGRGSLSKR